MSLYTAKQCFDDAMQYINAQDDPVMWDLVNGLSELVQALLPIEDDIRRIKNATKA